MDTTLIVAVVTAVATLLGAWIAISRQTKKKTDATLDVYRLLGEKLFKVRYFGETIRTLLGSDPGPNFAQDIVRAGNDFRDACDNLQKMVGDNRLLVSKKMYNRVADLISASADLIESLNRGMGGAVTPDQIARELTDRGNVFKKCLKETEDLLSKEGRAL